ncbi:hypothetical protein AAU61_01255 [Desulfocarbo indianensis]|nr:hypothetical protein AAU61_01255 [Desulfocarbo indianensis]
MKMAGSKAVFDQVRFEELAERFLIDQAASEHLEAYLNGMLVADISSQALTRYVLHRFRQGAGTDRINGELRALSLMFDRAMATVPPKSFHAPRIPVPAEVEAMRRAWLKSSNDDGGT